MGNYNDFDKNKYLYLSGEISKKMFKFFTEQSTDFVTFFILVLQSTIELNAFLWLTFFTAQKCSCCNDKRLSTFSKFY